MEESAGLWPCLTAVLLQEGNQPVGVPLLAPRCDGRAGTFTGCVCPGQQAQVSPLISENVGRIVLSSLVLDRWAASKPPWKPKDHGPFRVRGGIWLFKVSRSLAPECQHLEFFSTSTIERSLPPPSLGIPPPSELLGITRDTYAHLFWASPSKRTRCPRVV